MIPDEAKPALLRTYQTFVAKAMGDDYDIRNYPHRAVLAFVNWPIGVAPRNPADALPKVRFDSVHGYASFRNQWEGDDDVIVSAWANTGPRGWIGRRGPGQPGMDHGEILFWAYGKRRSVPDLLPGTGPCRRAEVVAGIASPGERRWPAPATRPIPSP